MFNKFYRRSKTLVLSIVLFVGSLFMTACSSVNTGPDQVALHYEGGSYTSQKFKECIDSGTKEFNGPGDKHYVYPSSSNQRVYDFTGGEGSDAERISIGTKDTIQMTVPGVVRFTLDVNCDPIEFKGKKYEGGSLQLFHELVGRRDNAHFDEISEPSAGWNIVLDRVIGQPLDATLDREALAFTWREIYTNPEAKEVLDKEVAESLQQQVNEATQGFQFFKIDSVQLQKPEPPAELLQALASEQTKIANAKAQTAEAEAQVKTAQAQKALADAEAAKKRAEIAGYGSVEDYARAKVAENGGNPFQPTYVVPQGGTQK